MREMRDTMDAMKQSQTEAPQPAQPAQPAVRESADLDLAVNNRDAALLEVFKELKQALTETVSVQKELREDMKGVHAMMDGMKCEQYETKAEIMVMTKRMDREKKLERLSRMPIRGRARTHSTHSTGACSSSSCSSYSR